MLVALLPCCLVALLPCCLVALLCCDATTAVCRSEALPTGQSIPNGLPCRSLPALVRLPHPVSIVMTISAMINLKFKAFRLVYLIDMEWLVLYLADAEMRPCLASWIIERKQM